jgi:hypothetical protein
MKVLILVRKEPLGGHRAYISSKEHRHILIQDNGSASLNQTVVDALEFLLEKTCEWLGQDEHRHAAGLGPVAGELQLGVYIKVDDCVKDIEVKGMSVTLTSIVGQDTFKFAAVISF